MLKLLDALIERNQTAMTVLAVLFCGVGIGLLISYIMDDTERGKKEILQLMLLADVLYISIIACACVFVYLSK
ncbi:MAG: hypothetical protein FWH06_01270 [Oscillospiraceae bacterium]|nr:hypothetical protein [Oscillospiraceae bacterium]